MNKARQVPINRCFGADCPKNTKQQKEEELKELLITAVERRRANKEIDFLLQRFHGRKSILDLLPAMKQRGFPPYVLRVALERVEGKRHGLEIEDVIFLEKFKASLAKPKDG